MLRFSKTEKNRAAFTLVELVITMALFLLVAGLVISYIVFMNNYTKRNENNSARAEQLTAVRKEIDRWFSWFDGFNFSLSLPANGETYIAKFTGEGAEFELYLELAPLDSGGGNLQYDLTPILRAEYPASAPYGNEASNKKIVSTPCSLIRSLSIVPYSANWEYSPNDSEALVLRFLVSMHITEGVYACEIAYK